MDTKLTTPRPQRAVPRAALLDAWSAHPWRDGLVVDDLSPLDQLTVQTRNSTYEIIIVSPRAAEVIVRGGRFFPTPTPVRLAGSSLGGSFLKQHGIYVGFRMELQYDGQTIVTTEVCSIARTVDQGVQ